MVGPTVPLPPSVPPKLTNTGEEAIEPFTLNVPALTKVGPLYVFTAVSTVLPLPTCTT
jgi:hypothetical protein